MKLLGENQSSSGKYEYKNIAKAVGYWVVLNDIKDFFKNAEMEEIYINLSQACDEIDKIWKDYESGLD